MKYWCEHPWRSRFDNARTEELCAKCGRPTDAPLHRHRHGDRTFPERTFDLHAAARARGGDRLVNRFEVLVLR